MMPLTTVATSGAAAGSAPAHEVDRTHGHADTEDDAGHGLLAAALAKGEHQAATDDADQRQPARDRPGKCVFEDGDGLEPGVCAHRVTGAHSKIATTHIPRWHPLLFVDRVMVDLPVCLLIGIQPVIVPLEGVLQVPIP